MRIREIHLLREIRELGVGGSDLARLVVFTFVFAIFEGVGITFLLPALELVSEGRPTSGLSRALASLLPFRPEEHPAAALALLLLLAFVPLALRSLFQYVRDSIAGRLKHQLAASVRERAAGAIVRANASFYLGHDRGALLAALTTEADRAADALATRLVFLATFAMTVIYVALLGFISWRLTLGALPLFLLVAAAFRRQSGAMRSHSEALSRAYRAFSQEASNVLNGIPLVKMRGAEEWAADSLARSARSIAAAAIGIERLRVVVETAIHPLVVLAALAVLFVSIVFFKMTLVSLGLYLFILVRLIPQLTIVNSLWAHMHAYLASSRNLEALVAEASASQERAGGEPAPPLERSIVFRNVRFRYPTAAPGSDQLRDISFELPKGSLTAVVGRSGAGKTTLSHLLTGLHAPTAGEILVDSVPLGAVDARSWRRRTGLVPQEPFLFNRTIRWNLNFGVDAAPDDAALRTLLARAHCDFVWGLPLGLETEVGERGVRLSQGQRQRLAIAHALACGTELLVLDEPTSALDAESEAALQATFERWQGAPTMLVIAHRLSTIRHAGQILVLDAGTIAARGRHDGLLASSPLYRTLFETQLLAG